MRRLATACSWLVLLLLLTSPGAAAPPQEQQATWRRWVAEMKDAPRGPFQRIRWFCRDGAVLPPEPYACRNHGGGIQHGELGPKARDLRADGFQVANILASIEPAVLLRDEEAPFHLKQILLERFLLAADDGWIFRKARYYRGALQAEDEAAAGRALLLELCSRPRWRAELFPVLREAARLLPHGRADSPLTAMRELSKRIAEEDRGFETLRIKLHVHPEPGDAGGVRDYAGVLGRPELADDYLHLAELIDAVHRPGESVVRVRHLAEQVSARDLGGRLLTLAGELESASGPSLRQRTFARLLTLLRERLADAGGPAQMLEWLDLSLDLERESFANGGRFVEALATTDRAERLAWVTSGIDILYGCGLLGNRERRALQDSSGKLAAARVPLPLYKEELDYLARVAAWADRALRFHFSAATEHLARIEPIIRGYFHDRLRGSPLLALSNVLDSLVRDANDMLGIGHELFGEATPSGLRAFHPGLARGILHLVQPGEPIQQADPQGIYLLPETRTDLPPLAGLISAGAGGLLSHTQLLARNLGIPSIAVDNRLIPRIAAHEGETVVLAASPLGQVRLTRDAPKWDEAFSAAPKTTERLIPASRADLDLETRKVLPLSQLRSSDAGRLAGPKAANLGELKRLFPGAVPDGLVIPFGVFAALLEESPRAGEMGFRNWLRAGYAELASLRQGEDRGKAARRFLQAARQRIMSADFDVAFRDELRRAMEQTFGEEGGYGVFVRSDTNVEDLPGFTGAGLNLTVPNVVGFDAVLEAIKRVWAAAFSERAYGWRQAHMERPEEVYPSVLLMRSVPVEKSGVLVTADTVTGDRHRLTVAVSEGVGGVVTGEMAEELRIDLKSGEVRLIAPAAEAHRRVLPATGGVETAAAAGRVPLLNSDEIAALRRMARALPKRFAPLRDARSEVTPADVEFGFIGGQLVLFQVRPFLESDRARRNAYLNRLDRSVSDASKRTVKMNRVPRGERR